MLLNIDCRTLSTNISYDYVLTSPPDPETDYWEGNDYSNYLESCYKLLTPTKAVTIITRDRKKDGFWFSKADISKNILEKYGFHLSDHNIWTHTEKDKEKPSFYNIQTFSKIPIKTYNNDILIFKRDTCYSYNSLPVALAEWCINTFSIENDTIYDLFMGSGTVAVAAKLCNRNYLGTEINKTAWTISKNRLNTIFYNSRKNI